MAKIAINKSLCIGCGTCEASCPDVFELKDDGKAHVKEKGLKNTTCDLEEVAANCPAQAISVK